MGRTVRRGLVVVSALSMQIETRMSSMSASAGKAPALAATSQQLPSLQTMTYTSESSTRSELYKRCTNKPRQACACQPSR